MQLRPSVDVFLTEGGKQLSGGGAQAPAGAQRKGAGGDEGRSRRTQVTKTTELCTTKQGAHTFPLQDKTKCYVATVF